MQLCYNFFKPFGFYIKFSHNHQKKKTVTADCSVFGGYGEREDCFYESLYLK